jgi:hypothetical protein
MAYGLRRSSTNLVCEPPYCAPRRAGRRLQSTSPAFLRARSSLSASFRSRSLARAMLRILRNSDAVNAGLRCTVASTGGSAGAFSSRRGILARPSPALLGAGLRRENSHPTILIERPALLGPSASHSAAPTKLLRGFDQDGVFHGQASLHRPKRLRSKPLFGMSNPSRKLNPTNDTRTALCFYESHQQWDSGGLDARELRKMR